MNSENKREQQNKRKQTSTQPKQHVNCNWQTFMDLFQDNYNFVLAAHVKPIAGINRPGV